MGINQTALVYVKRLVNRAERKSNTGRLQVSANYRPTSRISADILSHMNNIVAWIYGASAAGKETFIRKIVSDNSLKIIDELGWSNRTIIACEESLKWVGQFDSDPKIEMRKQIPDLVTESLREKENIVLLIKGQDVDLEENLPLKLYGLLPNCIHSIVFLKADTEQLYTRGQQKIWWRPENTKETAEGWLNYQIELLKRIINKLSIRAINSNTEDYYLVELPEKLL